MDADLEILPAPITDFRLPPGLELPANVVMIESEAARFCRESPTRFRDYRFAGTGPAFVLSPNGNVGVTYLVWDLIAWMVARRRTEMPRSRLRGRRIKDAEACAA